VVEDAADVVEHVGHVDSMADQLGVGGLDVAHDELQAVDRPGSSGFGATP
jgi:hypothetical protein